jgi:hypothetical protein
MMLAGALAVGGADRRDRCVVGDAENLVVAGDFVMATSVRRRRRT